MIDVGGFDGIDLLLDLADLSVGLFESTFVEFLSAESGFSGCRGMLAFSLVLCRSLPCPVSESRAGLHTSFIRAYIFPGYSVLLSHLRFKMFFSFL